MLSPTVVLPLTPPTFTNRTHPHPYTRFCNVRYVIALLRDLLVGLDVAQRVLGFTHYDLK